MGGVVSNDLKSTQYILGRQKNTNVIVVVPTGGRAAFRDFLKCEYSEENILFWQACEDLKTEDNPSVIEEKARLIYEDYISILSPKEVGTAHGQTNHDHI